MRPSVVVPVEAAPVIVIDAVTEVAEVEVIVPLTPLLPDTTAEALDRPVPVNVTGKVVPAVPDAGFNDASVVAGSTVKLTVYGVPLTTRPTVVPPIAAALVIVIEAPTEVADVEVTVPLTPALPDTTAVALERFVPVKVTGNVVPTIPVTWLTDVTVTAGLTVKDRL